MSEINLESNVKREKFGDVDVYSYPGGTPVSKKTIESDKILPTPPTSQGTEIKLTGQISGEPIMSNDHSAETEAREFEKSMHPRNYGEKRGILNKVIAGVQGALNIKPEAGVEKPITPSAKPLQSNTNK